MSRPAMAHGRESKAVALRAAHASIEANVTAFEVAAQLLAEGLGTRRRQVPLAVVRSRAATERPAKSTVGVRALG